MIDLLGLLDEWELQGNFSPHAGITEGNGTVRTLNCSYSRYSVLIAFLAVTVGLGILAAPSSSHAQNGTAEKAGGAAPPATPPAGSSKLKPGELPPGDGKAIAEQDCALCHALTNLTEASKSLDEWRDTVQTMIDRGASVPGSDLDTLVHYLAKNFGPSAAAPAAGAQTAPGSPAPSAAAPPSAPARLKPGELPPGDGKAIAENFCALCHTLTNLTEASMSLDEWRDEVQTMMNRGAAVPPGGVDTLVRYLAKNFGPKPSAPASGGAAGSAPSTSSPKDNH